MGETTERTARAAARVGADVLGGARDRGSRLVVVGGAGDYLGVLSVSSEAKNPSHDRIARDWILRFAQNDKSGWEGRRAARQKHFRAFRVFRGQIVPMISTLEGRWRPLYAELDGEQAPQEVLQQTEFELAAGIYTVRFGGVAADTGSFVVETESSHHLTLHGAVGPNAGRTIPCLFKFLDETLMICFGLGGTRPKNFRTAPGAQLYLVTYRRQA